MEQNSTLNEQFKAELAEVDARIEELQNSIDLGKMLEELHEDEKFQKVILEGYLDKEADRLFGMLTTPTHLKRDQLENLMDKLTAIRNFKAFFATILTNAHMAPMQIEEENAHRAEITERHANGDYLPESGSEE